MYLQGLNSIVKLPTWVTYPACNAMGGTFSPVNDGSLGECFVKQADAPVQQASAPANITVNTSTNTQVSPVISPNLIQQQQPTNSPIGATTSGAPSQSAQSPVSVAPATPPDTSLTDFLKQMEADQMARDKAAQDAQAKLLAAQNAAPAQQVSTQYVPAPDSGTPAPATTPVATQASSMQSYLPFILAGVGLLAVVAMKKKGK